MPHDGKAKRALARAVGAHQGVDFAAVDLQIHAAENRLPFDRDVQILIVSVSVIEFQSSGARVQIRFLSFSSIRWSCIVPLSAISR